MNTLVSANAALIHANAEPEKIAALGWQAVRELFPVREAESDLALKLRLEMLSDIVREAGAERFMAAIKLAVTQSRNRHDVSIFRIRECAGLRYVPEPAPAYKAWQFVTQVKDRHVRRDPEGFYRLEPWYTSNGTDVATVTEVPAIPEPIKRAVQALGGWAALATCPAEFWHQRMKDFISVYNESEQ
jgi:hypothetical protein